MLLDGGELDGVRLLSPKTVELMTANHVGRSTVRRARASAWASRSERTVGRAGQPGVGGRVRLGRRLPHDVLGRSRRAAGRRVHDPADACRDAERSPRQVPVAGLPVDRGCRAEAGLVGRSRGGGFRLQREEPCLKRNSPVGVDGRDRVADNLERRRAPVGVELAAEHPGVDEEQRAAEAFRDPAPQAAACARSRIA